MDAQMNIYQRLNAVMKQVSYVQKEEKMVNNQYRFVSHDAVTAKVRPFLIEQGVLMTTNVVSFTNNGNRTEVMVALEFINIDKPDERITINSLGYGIDPQDKGPGKAVSYAVKYGILKTLCLETGDDPERDTIAHEPEHPKQEQMKPVSAKPITRDVFDSLDVDTQEYLREHAMHAIAYMAKGNYVEALAYLESLQLDADLKTGMFSLFDSKQRAAIKAVSTTRKAA